MYDNGNDSVIKKVIDKWYSDNMVDYTDMLEDTVWCNDRSISKSVAGDAIYYGQFRGESHVTTMVCPRKEDSFTVDIKNGNGKLIYPVALLTNSEVRLTSNSQGIGYNNSNFLAIGRDWWLMSPNHFNLRNNTLVQEWVGNVNAGYTPLSTAGVRPSISLISGTMIKEGDGSVSNPYKLVEDKVTKEWSFDYTGTEQEFKVPYDGTYKIELWGASGADWSTNSDYLGGKGAYTSGNMELEKDTILYIYVGEEGKDWSINRPFGQYSFNGGSGGSYTCYSYNNGRSALNHYGGSASDIRLVGGSWDNNTSLSSRIMVASGGGSGGQYSIGGAGGGLTGYGTTSATGATQTEGGGPSKGSFGKGGYPINMASTCNNSNRHGASSGYYGGGVNNITSPNINGMHGGASGSSFISGHTGCVAITSEQDQTPKSGCTTGASDNICSIHYSNKVFTDTKMIDGAGYNWTNTKGEYNGMPSHDGDDIMIGNIGNGYAKITLTSIK